MFRQYSNIKELVEAVELATNETVINGWIENRYYVCFLSSNVRVKLLLP